MTGPAMLWAESKSRRCNRARNQRVITGTRRRRPARDRADLRAGFGSPTMQSYLRARQVPGMCERDGADCTLQPKPANTAASKRPAPSLSHPSGFSADLKGFSVAHLNGVPRKTRECFSNTAGLKSCRRILQFPFSRRLRRLWRNSGEFEDSGCRSNPLPGTSSIRSFDSGSAEASHGRGEPAQGNAKDRSRG